MRHERPDHDLPAASDIAGGIHGLNRMRLQFLVSQHASIVTQTQFADAKAAALMTLLGLLALNGPVKLGEVSLADPGAIALFLVNLAAILCCFWAIAPRFPDADLRRKIRRAERFSWPALVAHGHEPLGYAAEIRGAEAEELLTSLSLANSAGAAVLLRKFAALRIAFLIAVFYLGAIVLHVTGVLPH